MATQRDTLETVLALVGAQQYIQYLNQAAAAHQRLALAQQVQQRAQGAVQGAMAGGRTVGTTTTTLAGGAGMAAAQGAAAQTAATAIALAALVATTAAVKASVDAFADYDRAVLRTQLFLKNFGTNLPTRQFTDFARQLSQATGTSQTDIVNLEGYLARFGTSGPTIERATRVILGASKATGVSLEQLARGIEMARRGHARELWSDLGIPIRAVEGQLLDLNKILDIIDRHTKDGAGIFANTLPGAMDRASAALETLKIDFGNLISPLVITWLNQVANLINWVANGIHGLNDALGITPSKLGTAAANGIGAGGADRSEDYLRKIEYNTGPQGPLGRAVRGGGSYGEPGGGLRIRDFNQMFRHLG